MREVGTVESVENGMATIIFDRHEACGACRACTPLEGEKKMSIVLPNTKDARVGDRVTVELEGKTMISASAIAYGLPLITLVIGAAAGEWIRSAYGFSEVFSAGIAILSAGLGYGLLHLLNPLFEKRSRFRPAIHSVIEKE